MNNTPLALIPTQSPCVMASNSNLRTSNEVPLIDGTMMDTDDEDVNHHTTSHSSNVGNTTNVAMVTVPTPAPRTTNSFPPEENIKKRARVIDVSHFTDSEIESYVKNFENVTISHINQYKILLKLRRKNRLSVLIHGKHLERNTFPKDIDYVKKTSNPYPKSCRDRDTLLKQEEDILLAAQRAMVAQRLEVATKLLEATELNIQVHETTVHILFSELDDLKPSADNASPSLLKLCQLYRKFIDDLTQQMSEVEKEIRDWEHKFDEKFYRKHPSERPMSTSSASAAAPSEDSLPSSTPITKDTLKPILMEILSELQIPLSRNDVSSNKSNSTNVGQHHKKHQNNNNKRKSSWKKNHQNSRKPNHHTQPRTTTQPSNANNSRNNHSRSNNSSNSNKSNDNSKNDKTPYKTALLANTSSSSSLETLISQLSQQLSRVLSTNSNQSAATTSSLAHKDR